MWGERAQSTLSSPPPVWLLTPTHRVDDPDEVEELGLGELVEQAVVRERQAQREDHGGELGPGLVPARRLGEEGSGMIE